MVFICSFLTVKLSCETICQNPANTEFLTRWFRGVFSHTVVIGRHDKNDPIKNVYCKNHVELLLARTSFQDRKKNWNSFVETSDFFFCIEIKLIDKVFSLTRWSNHIFCDIILSDISTIGEIKGSANVIKEERGSWYSLLII